MPQCTIHLVTPQKQVSRLDVCSQIIRSSIENRKQVDQRGFIVPVLEKLLCYFSSQH